MGKSVISWEIHSTFSEPPLKTDAWSAWTELFSLDSQSLFKSACTKHMKWKNQY